MPLMPSKTICPHVGLSSDPTVAASAPTKLHRCYQSQHVLAPTLSHQANYCLGKGHANCPLFDDKAAAVRPAPRPAPVRQPAPKAKGSFSRQSVSRILAAGLLVLLLGAAYYLSGAALAEPDEDVVVGAATRSPAQPAQPPPTLSSEGEVNNVASASQSTPQKSETGLITERFVTPTPEAGGEVHLITPAPGFAGWWSSNSTLTNHLGDSFLYAGQFEGQSYIAGIRFDLSKIPRGASISHAQLRLTGLRDDRLAANVDGTWLVQLVPESSLAELTQADFLTFYSAPASITLFPQLHAADLGREQVNTWTLDETIRAWLEQQLLDGATSVTVRISAATPDGETLFAWDSGLGPETAGDAATLLLSVGAPPPTLPPLPTRPLIVATLTPVPDNVMTVVAYASTATAEAYAFGTRTPFPYQVVTPTPFPENFATVQAVALAKDLAPVLLNTPVPANAATAQYHADYATAVALTTGTFTPVPPGYVTPMLVYPSPPAENVATAAARVVQATQVAASGVATPTPLPYNAVMAIYAFATETPSNNETAVAMVREQNAAAAITGTPTPTPWNLVVITAVPEPTSTEIPSPTPLPLTLAADVLTPTPSPTPTRIFAAADLEQFRNKILFLSDRSGSEQVWVMEPESGQVTTLVTDPQIMALARDLMLAYSPNRQEQAIVQADNNGDLQIKILSLEYGSTRQITHFRETVSYDPAWSPRGDQIAFVSTDSGNDEIYVVDTEGKSVQQLTNNGWEWDKHPSWSPDGSRIVFFSNRNLGRTQIWMMNADGSGQRNLSNNQYNDWNPVWIR